MQDAGDVREGEVAAELPDEVGWRAVGEVGVEIEGVDALEELETQDGGLGRVGFGVDGFLDGADDLLALRVWRGR